MKEELKPVDLGHLVDEDDFYVCPHHEHTGGYESCCECGGWEDGDENFGRLCTQAIN